MKRLVAAWAGLLTAITLICAAVPAYAANVTALTSELEHEVDTAIQEQMKHGHMPGMSVVIVQGDQIVYQKGFGYSDQEADKPVNEQTLFELGSTSKAFTALGVLRLVQEGKLALTDPVQQYLPWLKLYYDGEEQSVSIEQFLHHTSGIPFDTIDDIPASGEDNALDRTVRTLIGQELAHEPGSSYLYATINYDVLARVIEQITGTSFEQYMKDQILVPLGLNNTYMSRQDIADQSSVAVGYKVRFTGSAAYDAPEFRGNTAAGYVMTNAADMAQWLKVQLGTAQLTEAQRQWVEQSHRPDRTIRPNEDGSSYAMGWSVFQDGGGELSHDGSNPNYSSYVGLRPEEKIGVAVMSNLNSTYTIAAGQSILNMMIGKPAVDEKQVSDMFLSIDRTSLYALLIVIPLVLLTLVFFVMACVDIIKKRRKWSNRGWKGIFVLVSLLGFVAFVNYCLYLIPDVLFQNLTWDFVRVWAPESFPIAVVSIGAAAMLFYLFSMFVYYFPKQNDKSLFNLAVLSIISGLGNAFIIFTINISLGTQQTEFQTKLFLFFMLGIVVYIVGQRIIRVNLVSITNDIVYNKRMELIQRILKSPFHRFEEIEGGKVHAGLNNDTEMISNFANTFITGVTSLITLICCLVYLGMINWLGLLVAVGIIALSLGLYTLVGMSANKLWGETRDIQNVFFQYINDLVQGFKELSMNRRKQQEFTGDIQQSCESYRDKRKLAEYRLANAFVIGELLFTLIVGFIAFLFPVLFHSITPGEISTYVFIFLYMMGPIHSILGAVPNVIQMRISWKRINGLIQEVTGIEAVAAASDNETKPSQDAAFPIHLELMDVRYQYQEKNGESFAVGPIRYHFHSNEVIFITGGNGSGKSTLAKLITGLYVPSNGEILLNGNKVDNNDLSDCFSTIFSDFYLFDKMYGVDTEQRQEEINRYLKLLGIKHKVDVTDGRFSTTKLSTGQRKRLALMVSYLEDKPICLFDEWAADQDPEFRKFFYESLLPELKNRGKCVIAITHDDRYFHLADKVMKMEFGQLLEQQELQELQAVL